MNAVPSKWPQAAKDALQALYSHEPMTDEQRAERKRLIAREYARREAREQGQANSQLPLEGAD